jgi:hypothetical protein
MPSAQKLDTHHKALTLNLDPSTFVSFAEIGARQEVARGLAARLPAFTADLSLWFRRVHEYDSSTSPQPGQLVGIDPIDILAFHLALAPASIGPALVASVLWVLVFLQYRESFKGIFRAKPATYAAMNRANRHSNRFGRVQHGRLYPRN